MRIAILTQPLRYNYGGILQNFALQIGLQKMGHEVLTLDPKRCHYRQWQYFRYSLYFWWRVLIFGHTKVGEKVEKRRFVLFSMDYILRHSLFRKLDWEILKNKCKDNETLLLGRNTFPFINKHIRRQEYANLYEEVLPDSFDAFVVGSDQVWRVEYNSNFLNMFLDFTKGWSVRRIAYAASFGVDTWNVDAELTEQCKQLLKQFDFVSVRETSGVELCKDVFEVEAVHLLDPTLLLAKEEYISLLHLDRVPRSKGNLLVYILDYTDDKRKLIQQITNDCHLVPFRVNSDVEDYCLADISKRIQPPVEQWLRGFYDADYVITDSFHACVFSIIFGKPFVVYANNNRGNARFRSLLSQFSLTDCMVSSSEEFHGFSIYSKTTSEILNELREKSIGVLRSKLD